MDRQILKLLSKNARATAKEIAVMLGRTEEEGAAEYPEVESVYLMSGVYDLSVMVRGKTFQEVAMFVAKELSTIDSVTQTATHFVLRRYKEMDVELHDRNADERGTFLL